MLCEKPNLTIVAYSYTGTAQNQPKVSEQWPTNHNIIDNADSRLRAHKIIGPANLAINNDKFHGSIGGTF